jgi:hypothetical protein
MLKRRLEAARAVQADFLSAERANGEAALNSARALATALQAHDDINLPAAFGMSELTLLAKSAMLALESRNCLIEAHRTMAAMPRDIGIPERAWGDFDECPEKNVATIPSLRVA